jgi:hypothetical protein
MVPALLWTAKMARALKKQQYIAQNVEMIRSAVYEKLSGNAVKLLILMQTRMSP